MSEAVKQLEPAEAHEFNSSGKWKYLDVRTAEEFSGGHAPGAVNVPVMLMGPGGMSPNPTFVEDLEALVPDKATALLVGCRSGARSTKALAVMEAQGYSQLAHNSKGWMAWEAAGLPVEQ